MKLSQNLRQLVLARAWFVLTAALDRSLAIIQDPATKPEERELHRVIDRQGLAEQLTDALIDRGLVALGARPTHILAEAILGGLLDRREAAVGAERGTASQQQAGAGQRQGVDAVASPGQEGGAHGQGLGDAPAGADAGASGRAAWRR